MASSARAMGTAGAGGPLGQWRAPSQDIYSRTKLEPPGLKVGLARLVWAECCSGQPGLHSLSPCACVRRVFRRKPVGFPASPGSGGTRRSRASRTAKPRSRRRTTSTITRHPTETGLELEEHLAPCGELLGLVRWQGYPDPLVANDVAYSFRPGGCYTDCFNDWSSRREGTGTGARGARGGSQQCLRRLEAHQLLRNRGMLMVRAPLCQGWVLLPVLQLGSQRGLGRRARGRALPLASPEISGTGRPSDSPARARARWDRSQGSRSCRTPPLAPGLVGTRSADTGHEARQGEDESLGPDCSRP